MSKITKQMAENIAIKLCSKKKIQLDEASSKLSFFVTGIAKRRVPKEVTIAFETHSEYIKQSKCVYVNGQGITRWESATLSEKVPIKNEHLNLTPKEAEKYIVLKNKYNDIEKEYKNLILEVENALLSCRTYNKVKELLPEAAQYLPPVYDPPALNFADIRKKIK